MFKKTFLSSLLGCCFSLGLAYYESKIKANCKKERIYFLKKYNSIKLMDKILEGINLGLIDA